jgi:hypothetical protein
VSPHDLPVNNSNPADEGSEWKIRIISIYNYKQQVMKLQRADESNALEDALWA